MGRSSHRKAAAGVDLNFTEDAHPIHVHQPQFQVVERRLIDFVDLNEDGIPDDTNGSGITSGYGAADFALHDIWIGDLVPLSPEDMGRQDTIIVPPGEMVSIVAQFDLPGEYVWHCHILSHEDHEMMRPFEVVDPAVIVFQQMYGFAPSDPQLDNLHAFQQAQLNYALSIGATDPTLYLYEVLGLGLSEGASFFGSTYGPLAVPNDATFVVEAYESAFGFAPGQAQVDHFVQQLDHLGSIYASSGAYGTDPVRIDLLARGAVYGQILGVAAELDFLT